MIELREHEVRALQALAELGSPSKSAQVAAKTGLDEAAVMRAALSLVEEGYVSVKDETALFTSLTPEGRDYAEKGLPERRILRVVLDHGGRMESSEAARVAGVPMEMLPIVYGWLKKKGWSTLEKSDGRTIIIAQKDAEASRDEDLLGALAKSAETDASRLSSVELAELHVLKQRRLAALHERVEKAISITNEGLNLVEQGIAVQREVSSLTPEMLATGSWHQTKLRKYDVQAEVAPIWPGKKQPYKRFLDELKWKLIALGFREMTGPIVETMFFNCDALYMPQDHPAREVHDIYLVKSPEYGDSTSFAGYLDNGYRVS